ncbi:hypothetical protein C9374_010683 [Naegleria lovaniensis]|uniref:Calcineurin-like phosphoesterase domain-containing protein n=1 Tax=Naegleria lovaniensis TaxID=51637 RepID=A0AA88GG46_NAELO|nr:uncharacterized protein C9374_010683 [Naegleria lovaniensis]KAG2374664.1 hypothetical protein C9374_010683 [Naegleria lovaniensis]
MSQPHDDTLSEEPLGGGEGGANPSNSSRHHYYSLAAENFSAPQKKRIGLGTLAILFGIGCVIISALIVLIVVSAVLYWGPGQNKKIYPNPSYTPSSDYLHFIVVGDQGRGNDEQKKVAESMARYCNFENGMNPQKLPCQFIIGTGDNIYDNGVTDVNDVQFKTKFEDIYVQESLKNLDWYFVLGNHDYRTNPEAQIAYSQLSKRWKLPKQFYNFDKISTENKFKVSFVMLDTNPFVNKYFSDSRANQTALNQQRALNNEQVKMVENILNTNMNKNDTWTLVVGHHPLFSAGSHGPVTQELVDNFEPLFVKYKLPMYLCGHDHLLNWLSSSDSGFPTQYVISGGGAGNTRPMIYNKYSLNDLNDSGFFSVEVQQSFMFVRAFDKYGTEVWKFKISRPPQ